MSADALILVDIQNDFVPGGALAVPEGDQIVPLANRLQQCFELIVATQDWHPATHGSFATNHNGRKPGDVINLNGVPQILWSDHCVQNTPGADFVPALIGPGGAGSSQKALVPRSTATAGFSIMDAITRLDLAITSGRKVLPIFTFLGWRQITV
jgi:nicotinamidase/pyrazinamidase